MDGVTECWTKVTADLNLLPDEGVCVDVLHAAGRHGLPELASDVLRVLKVMGAPWQEYHFAALIDAFCHAGQIKDAFLTLSSMRSADLVPIATSTSSIFDIISKDVDALDSAWSIVEEITKEGHQIDVAALNAIIKAAVALGEQQHAMGIYKTFAEYNTKPTLETFNTLLFGCIAASHRELGDRILADMKEAKVKPDAQTYENIIQLCLTQETYEDAFFYLEEMKASKHRPTYNVYSALILKCHSMGDARSRLAAKEMTECGYLPSRSLREAIGGTSFDRNRWQMRSDEGAEF
jgi:pentatricopeptide repeat protein